MIMSLLVAMVLIAIICVFGWFIQTIIPGPAVVKNAVWAVTAILCLIILLRAITGGGFGFAL